MWQYLQSAKRSQILTVFLLIFALQNDTIKFAKYYIKERKNTMKKSIFKRVICVALSLMMCLSIVIGTGAISASALSADLYLRGAFNSWGTSDKMTTSDNVNYTATVSLAAGTYEYKYATEDWSTYQYPVSGNLTMTLASAATVKFTINTSTHTASYEIKEDYELEDALEKVVIRNYWSDHSDKVLALADGQLTYASTNDADYDNTNHLWNIIPTTGGFYLQNWYTKEYAYANGSIVSVSSTGNSTSAGIWTIKLVNGNKRFLAANGDAINIENWRNGVELATLPTNYESAHWVFEFEEYDYTMSTDKISDTGFNAYVDKDADGNLTIRTYATGVEQKWTLTEDISQYPSFSAPNTPVAEAAYQLSMEELVNDTFEDAQVGTAFVTGTAWQKVWTRDTAYSNLLSLSWINPEVASNCSYKKVHTDSSTGIAVLEQDTGTGGSYPVSTDKIITMISMWETYLANGDKDMLAYFYEVGYNTMMQDLHVAMDAQAGLFRGETGGIDWRDQTYPDWMSSQWSSGMVDIAEGKSAVVNATYVRAYEIMARMADILGKGDDAVKFWTTAAETLEATISSELWAENYGAYASWQYPEYMGNILSEKVDVLGNGFALWFDVGTEEQMTSITENFPLVNYGALTTYPSKLGNGEHATRYYHNRGIWPGWQTIMMVGANLQGNETMAEEIFDSNIHCAVTYLSNYEVVNYETGEGIHSSMQLWSVAGTLAGYYRTMFGMNYDEDGITFNPTVADWMEGPFYLTDYKYHDATLNMTVTGKGDNVTSFKVDGVEEDIETYVFPIDATGTHTIEIALDGTEGEEDTINKSSDNLVICPSMPSLLQNTSNGSVYWTEEEGYTYKLWTGSTFIDTADIKANANTGIKRYYYDSDVYGSYSLMAISADGICSELSEPIVVSPDRITVQAESGTVSDSSYISNGYVIQTVDSNNNIYNNEVEVTVDVTKSGKYLLSAIYNNSGDAQSGISCGIRSVYVDGTDVGTLIFPEVYSQYTDQESSHLAVYLTKGTHTIKVCYNKTDWYDQNMAWYAKYDTAADKSQYTDIRKNTVELNYFNLDLVEEMGVEDPDNPTDPTTPTTPSSSPDDTTPTVPSSNPDDTTPTVPSSNPDDTTAPTTPSSNPDDTTPTTPSESTTPSETEPSESDDSTTQPTTAKTPYLSKSNVSLKAGATVNLTVKDNTTGAKVTYSVDNSKIASVSKNGKVTARSKGTTCVYAKVNGKTLKCLVTVKTNPKLVNNKNKEVNKLTVKAGKTTKVYIEGKAKSLKNSAYATTNKKVVKISGSKKKDFIKVKGIKAGKATVSVKVNGVKKLKLKVTVK